MHSSRVPSLVAILFFVISCSSDSTGPGPEPNGQFELRIQLSDASGNPKPGVEIQAWNRVPCWATPDGADCVMRGSPEGRVESSRAGVASEQRQGQPVSFTGRVPMQSGAADSLIDRLQGNYPNPFASWTLVRFSLAFSSPSALRVYDGAGRLIRTLVSERQRAGVHQVAWDGRDDEGRSQAGGSGVYEIRFTVWSPDSSRIVHQDTVFAARYEPHVRLLGYTDQQGVFESTDKALFPSVCDAPPLLAVNVDGVELGSFAFDDTLVIEAVDTAAGEVREYKRVLSDSVNRFELVWR